MPSKTARVPSSTRATARSSWSVVSRTSNGCPLHGKVRNSPTYRAYYICNIVGGYANYPYRHKEGDMKRFSNKKVKIVIFISRKNLNSPWNTKQLSHRLIVPLIPKIEWLFWPLRQTGPPPSILDTPPKSILWMFQVILSLKKNFFFFGTKKFFLDL